MNSVAQAERTQSINLNACHEYVKRLLDTEYIRQLHEGTIQADNVRPPFDPDMLPIIKSLENIARQSGKVRAVQIQIEDLKKISLAFAVLFREKPQESKQGDDPHARF
jgi:hypothetical protein